MAPVHWGNRWEGGLCEGEKSHAVKRKRTAHQAQTQCLSKKTDQLNEWGCTPKESEA